MTLKVGNKDVTDVKIGSKQVKQVYVGSKLVWSSGPPTDAEVEVEIKAGSTGLKMDTPEGFTTIQGGTSTNHPAGTQTAIGLNGASPITVIVKNSGGTPTAHFTFDGDTEIEKVTIKELGAFTNMSNMFENCSGIKTMIITADTSNVTNMHMTFHNLQALTSFPQIDLSSVTNLNQTWEACLSLTSMPSMDYSSVEVFTQSWLGCKALVCFAGTLDFSSLTTGNAAFVGCDVLVEPPPAGTAVRAALSATAGTYTNPGSCP
jgi:hypothetical protein